MLLRLGALAVSAAVLTSHVALALSPSDIPADTPVSQLVTTANAQLAAGKLQDALTYFDVAITRDPRNYLTIFKRGATYLSLGRSGQAQRDFDKVLELKPGFEGALIQRAKIKARNGDWRAARMDYEAAGKGEGQEVAELEEAQGAAQLAADAEKSQNWDECIHQAGIAIMTAGAVLELRNIRSRCRFEKGEVAEGVSDLHHVLQMNSGSTEPHLRISAMTFYSLGETDKGLAQVRKCLQSDPDSKSCRQLMRTEKNLSKRLKPLNEFVEKRQFASASKLLVKQGDNDGLINDAKADFDQFVSEGLIHSKAPNGLYARLLELACEAYIEMNNYRRAQSYCSDTLKVNPTSEWGLLSQAKRELEAEDFEAAIRTLNEAKEHHESQRVSNMLQEAQIALRRSKQKDYYKILGVSRDADEREIKRAYRKLTIKFHPDKASTQGISQEEAQKKMSEINEAHDTLTDPELKARVDRGEDPNDPTQQGGSPFQGSPFGGQQFVFRQGGGGGSFPGGTFQFAGGFPGF